MGDVMLTDHVGNVVEGLIFSLEHLSQGWF